MLATLVCYLMRIYLFRLANIDLSLFQQVEIVNININICIVSLSCVRACVSVYVRVLVLFVSYCIGL